ncbi:hypothetical protein HDV00_004562 [Rhizophlyctis rosea]|nr:hypothetical protein HDV00_004562 [Rhizophlyctis rosea]
MVNAYQRKPALYSQKRHQQGIVNITRNSQADPDEVNDQQNEEAAAKQMLRGKDNFGGAGHRKRGHMLFPYVVVHQNLFLMAIVSNHCEAKTDEHGEETRLERFGHRVGVKKLK